MLEIQLESQDISIRVSKPPHPAFVGSVRPFWYVVLGALFVVSCGEARQGTLQSTNSVSAVPLWFEPEDLAWPSVYYCPRSGVILGADNERAHGTTIYEASRATINLRIDRCVYAAAACIEVADVIDTPSRRSLKVLIPYALGRNPLPLDGGFLWWTPRRGNGSEFIEFTWSEELHGPGEYGYTIIDGRLKAFWGFDFTPDQSAIGGEACHLLEGDGLVGKVQLRREYLRRSRTSSSRPSRTEKS